MPSDDGPKKMVRFEHLLDDRDAAAMLTYVRNGLGNKDSSIKPEQVKKIRAEVKNKQGHYMLDD